MFWKSFKTEFIARNFSSLKRIIKFLLIAIIPFLYAFLSIWAFWDPIGKLGNSKVAVVNEDAPVLIFQYEMLGNDEYTIGIISDKDANAYSQENFINENQDYFNQIKNNQSDYYLYQGDDQNNQPILKKFSDFFNEKNISSDQCHFQWISGWTIFKNILSVSKMGNSDENTTWDLNFSQGTQGYDFKNVKYLDATNKTYNTNSYNTVITIQSGITKSLIGTILDVVDEVSNINNVGINTVINDLNTKLDSIQKIKIESKHSSSFIYGYYMNSIMKFSLAISNTLLPSFIAECQWSIIYDQLAYTPITDDEVAIDINGNSTKLIKNEEYIISNIATEDAHGKLKYADTLNGKMSNYKYDPNALATITPDQIDGKIYEIFLYLNNFSKTDLYIVLNKLNLISDYQKLFDDDSGFSPLGNDLFFLLNGITYDMFHKINFKSDNDLYFYSKIINKPVSIGEMIGYIDNFVLINDDFANILNKIETSLLNSQPLFLNDSAINETLFKDEFVKILNDAQIPDFTNLIVNLFTDIQKNLLNSVAFYINGSENAYYGLGIGLFFIVIGIFIGGFVQTFIYDRGKRFKAANAYEWYYSKTFLMAITVLVQATLAFCGALIAGWSILPIGTIFSLYLVILLAALASIFVVQFIWFAIDDETVGRFLIVIYLILNISCGGGIFPVFMQAKIVQIINFITIVRYATQLETILIFDVSNNNLTSANIPLILLNILGLVCFIIILGVISIFVAKLRHRTILYGTSNKKMIAKVIEDSELDIMFKTSKKEYLLTKNHDLIEKYKAIENKSNNEQKKLLIATKLEKLDIKKQKILNMKNDKTYYNWNAFPKNDRVDDIYWSVYNLKRDIKFNWYSRKFKDDLLKTNYSIYDEKENDLDGDK